MKRLTLMSLLIIPILISCSKPEPYAEVIIENFTKSCIATGGKVGYCRCVVNELPKYLSQKEYIKLETSYVTTGKLPDKMANALSEAVSTCSTTSK